LALQKSIRKEVEKAIKRDITIPNKNKVNNEVKAATINRDIKISLKTTFPLPPPPNFGLSNIYLYKVIENECYDIR
jgi:hypothetical protein